MKMGRVEKWIVNSPGHAERVAARVDKLLAVVEMGGKRDFLEVGCGVGAASLHLAGHYSLNVTGVDIDADQVSAAREKAGEMPNVRFIEADAASLPLGDNEFDIVLAHNVLHHVPNWLDALGEINRVLRPGGHFLYADLVYPRWCARLGSSGAGRRFARTYGFPTIGALTSFAEQNGLSALRAVQSGRWLLLFNTYEAVYRKPS